MVYKSFNEILEKNTKAGSAARMAVAAAGDLHTIEAALYAKDKGMVKPVFVGDAKDINEAFSRLGRKAQAEDIFDIPNIEKSAAFAVSLVKKGKASLLMKGKMDTAVLLKAVVDKENGLPGGGLMSHFTMFELSSYHKLLVAVDGGMVPYPTLEQKKAIIENTVSTLIALGYDKPKVGILACVEKLNPKMPETVEADVLAKLNESGEIADCIVAGPISYDCAVSREIADFKGYAHPCAGDCDILIAPNIHAGNIMGKMLTVTAGAKMAGFIVGAGCPIVMTSRGSSAEEKFLSIALSAEASK